MAVQGGVYTIFFRGPRYGWTENYHTTITNPVSMSQQVQKLVTARTKVLAQKVSVDNVRVTTSPSSRNFLLLQPSEFGFREGSFKTEIEQEFTRAQCILRAPGVNRNFIYLGGLGIDVVDLDSFSGGNFSDSFTAAFYQFANFLVTGPCAIALKNAVPTGPADQHTISNIAISTPRGVVLTTDTAGITTGQVIRITAPSTLWSGLSGNKTVVSVTPGSPGTILVGGVNPNGVYGPVSNGVRIFWVPVNYQYSALNNVVLGKVTERKPGRFFDLVRGRRPTLIPLRR
jgi:hypothetical protein